MPGRARQPRGMLSAVDAPLFSWIHLSDIHIGHGGTGYGPDQMLVLRGLRENIAQVIADWPGTP